MYPVSNGYKSCPKTEWYTHSNADFAQDLLWNPPGFLQHLVERASILQSKQGYNITPRRSYIPATQSQIGLQWGHIVPMGSYKTLNVIKSNCICTPQITSSGSDCESLHNITLHFHIEVWAVRVTLSYHVLHANADLSIAVESSVEAHNVGRVTLMQHLQLSDNLVSDGRFDL